MIAAKIPWGVAELSLVGVLLDVKQQASMATSLQQCTLKIAP